jgi:EmrB/QacA subfamily drug resistance transporter
LSIAWELIMARTARSDVRWWTLAAVALATFMTSLDNTVVNVALPSIQRDLGLTLAGLEWITSAYILVFASLLLAGGRLGDRYGHRTLFLVGLSLFTAASLLAGLAGTQGVLLAGRVLQGIGAALVTPATLAIIPATFPDAKQRNLAVALWSAVAALALAVGPLAGGLLSQHWHWSWIFFINVPIGAATLTLAALAIPKARDPVAPTLDLAGLATATVALFGMTYALIQGHDAGWTSPPILAALALATAAGGAFAVVESRSHAPMVDPTLFRNRVFTGGTLILLLWGLALIGVYFFTALYLQTVLGFSPTKAGLAFVPMALLMAAVAPLAAPLSERIGANRTVAAGMGLVAAGLLDAALLGAHAGFADLLAPMALLGIGSGLTMPLTANVLAVLPPGRAGVASGILNATREVAGLLGVTVIGALLTARRAQALAAGATPTAAFLHGYTTGLLAAALLVAIGGAVSLATLDRTATPQPAPAAGPRPARRAAATGSGSRRTNADLAGVRVPARTVPPAAAATAPRIGAAAPAARH